MSTRPLRIVVLGLSLSSSWGNGHATTYRALLRALAARGHDILFLERDVAWYAAHRDFREAPYCRLRFYNTLEDLARFRRDITRADAVIIGSYVPQGTEVSVQVLRAARGVVAFYDIDTPVTLASLERGTCEYVTRALIPQYDLYLSFTGGPTLRRLETEFGAKAARVLYCSVDAELYSPRTVPRRWDLGYLGTYSADRQPKLERLLIEVARRAPQLRFVVAGPQYPTDIRWPPNVTCIPHLAPRDHPEFYAALGWTLNVTRDDMTAAGYSPSVRLFEAAACATPIISDRWTGLDTLFVEGRELILANDAHDVLAALGQPEALRRRIGRAGRARILREHTCEIRAAELEVDLLAAIQRTRNKLASEMLI